MRLNNNKKIRIKKKWIGFQRYLYKIIISNIFLVMLPIIILGILWYMMVSNQAEDKFLQHKSIEMSEVSSSISNRIKAIELELAIESTETKYGSYTISKEYSTDLLYISNRLRTMTEKYSLLHSVYFYDETTGKIYTSKSGSYIFDEFYDIEWLKHKEDIYRIQQLPLRYTLNSEDLIKNYYDVFSVYNDLVLSLVIKGRPNFYLVANVSLNRLYDDIISTYELIDNNEEFFLLDSDGKLVDGFCEYIQTDELMQLNNKHIENDVYYVKHNNRIYFIKSFDFGITSVTSYNIDDSYQESRYLGSYIILACVGLLFFLIFISTYMAKKLYQPINTLYSDITENTKSLQKENVYDEIDMLKHVFMEINTFNTNAKQNLKRYEEINKSFNFRNYLELSQSQGEFLADHPYLFDNNGNCLCEILIIKLDFENDKSNDDVMLFNLSLQEVLGTYLHSSMKGILTKTDDYFILLYHVDQSDHNQTRKILTDTVLKLTNSNAYFVISNYIHNISEVISQYNICLDLIENSYFFNWSNEVITADRVKTVKNTDEIYLLFLNISTSIVQYIVSNNDKDIDNLIEELESKLFRMQNASQAKDACNRIIMDLDNEFHLSKSFDYNILLALNEKRTLADIITFIKNLLMNASMLYDSNLNKENNYCEQARKYLEENYMRDMNITDVADHLDISYSYLSKIFRTITDVTLTDYLNNYRIEKSKNYLTRTSLTLNEIAEKVGYNNVQSYQRFFKKHVSITPGNYRKLHNNMP